MNDQQSVMLAIGLFLIGLIVTDSIGMSVGISAVVTIAAMIMLVKNNSIAGVVFSQCRKDGSALKGRLKFYWVKWSKKSINTGKQMIVQIKQMSQKTYNRYVLPCAHIKVPKIYIPQIPIRISMKRTI